MKKNWFVFVFGIGILFLSAAVWTAVPKNEEYYEKQNVAVSPLLLSEVHMPDYVSLPIFEGMDIEEASNVDDEESARAAAYEELLRTAGKLTEPSGDCTAVCDITVSRANLFIESLSDYPLGLQKDIGKKAADFLKENPGETSIRLEHVTFNHFEDVNLDITVKGIYDIPEPVSDKYMKEHTEYDSFSSMVSSLIKNDLDQTRESLRQETMDNLIGYSMDQTTFMELPESLYDQEFEVLRKADSGVQFEDAKESLKKVFFIAAVLDRYSLADEQERFRIVNKYEEQHSLELEGYEEERMSYLLLEEEVNNYLYKIIHISEKTVG